MSETMPSPSDWTHFYHQNLSNQAIFGADGVSDATVVTTAVTSHTSSVPSSAGHLSPEGRVTKPVRRRSRASRRTPTTLLNTDTANFRAMVQQFTGGPSAPFPASASQLSAAQGFSFGFGGRQQGIVNPNSSLGIPGGGGAYYSSQYQQQQSHMQPYMLSLSNNGGGGGDNILMQRLGNQRVTTSSDHGLNMESGSGEMNRSRGEDNENRSNNFLY